MALQNGQSELDTLVLKLPASGREIKNHDRYTLSTEYLTPTDKFQFNISAEDRELIKDVLKPGTQVQLSINNCIQCTGFVDEIVKESDRNGGNFYQIIGRDILGRVVSSRADFEEEYKTSVTVLDVLNKLLPPYGIKTIYNDDKANINVITGYEPGKGKSIKSIVVQKSITGFEKKPDGSFKLDTNKQKIPIYEKKKVTTVTAASKPGLKKLTLEHLKPKPGEGEYHFMDRILKRHGLIMRAASDGSGVVVDAPDFEGPSIFTLYHKTGDLSSINNVIKSNIHINFDRQPSLIIGMGYGGGKKSRKSQFKAIMVNELVGVDANGNILPEVNEAIARHHGYKTMPIRPQLVPSRKLFSDELVPCFDYFKDEESKDQAQIEKMVQRRMAEDQQKALTITYELEGHSQNGVIWCVNTIVDVDDDVNDIHERMWIINRRFEKTRSGGTRTFITCIRPYTLLI